MAGGYLTPKTTIYVRFLIWVRVYFLPQRITKKAGAMLCDTRNSSTGLPNREKKGGKKKKV